jgi:hypothetical protein
MRPAAAELLRQRQPVASARAKCSRPCMLVRLITIKSSPAGIEMAVNNAWVGKHHRWHEQQLLRTHWSSFHRPIWWPSKDQRHTIDPQE